MKRALVLFLLGGCSLVYDTDPLRAPDAGADVSHVDVISTDVPADATSRDADVPLVDGAATDTGSLCPETFMACTPDPQPVELYRFSGSEYVVCLDAPFCDDSANIEVQLAAAGTPELLPERNGFTFTYRTPLFRRDIHVSAGETETDLTDGSDPVLDLLEVDGDTLFYASMWPGVDIADDGTVAMSVSTDGTDPLDIVHIAKLDGTQLMISNPAQGSAIGPRIAPDPREDTEGFLVVYFQNGQHRYGYATDTVVRANVTAGGELSRYSDLGTLNEQFVFVAAPNSGEALYAVESLPNAVAEGTPLTPLSFGAIGMPVRATLGSFDGNPTAAYIAENGQLFVTAFRETVRPFGSLCASDSGTDGVIVAGDRGYSAFVGSCAEISSDRQLYIRTIAPDKSREEFFPQGAVLAGIPGDYALLGGDVSLDTLLLQTGDNDALPAARGFYIVAGFDGAAPSEVEQLNFDRNGMAVTRPYSTDLDTAAISPSGEWAVYTLEPEEDRYQVIRVRVRDPARP